MLQLQLGCLIIACGCVVVCAWPSAQTGPLPVWVVGRTHDRLMVGALVPYHGAV
jgi:hypothetical protein